MQKLLFILLLVSTSLCAQNYNGPESAEFDYANNRWLIGNTSSHQVLSRDSAGGLSVLVANTVNGPYGIEIVGDTLYCCCGSSIKGYLLSNGSLVYNQNIGATFLNGITSDNNGNIYATDFSAKKIFKLDTRTQNASAITGVLPNTPNGIVYDEYNNRCVFVNWGTSAPIRAINLSDNSIVTLRTTSLSSCDGITRDGNGYYYISNWGASSIVKFDSSFSSPPVTVVTGLSSPADIFYNVVSDTLAIPNSGNNTVRFVSFASTTAINSAEETMLSIYPNPISSDGFVAHIANSATAEMIIQNPEGKIVLKKMVTDGERINIASFSKGIYLVTVISQRAFYSTRIVAE